MTNMGELVTTPEQVADNIRQLDAYSRGTKEEREFHRRTIKNGKLFVHLHIDGTDIFAPSRFAGYFGNKLGENRLPGRDGRDSNPRLDEILGNHVDKGDADYDRLDRLFLAYCEGFGIEPSKHHRLRRYWDCRPGARQSGLRPQLNAQVSGALWSEQELRAAVAAYFDMLDLEQQRIPYSKAAFRKALIAGPLKGRKSTDHRMQNVSFVLREMKKPWIQGFKPLPNVGKGNGEVLRRIIEQHLNERGGLRPISPPIPVPENRRLPPTGYWIFVCRRGRWDGEAWLRGEQDETLYKVSEHNRNEVQIGDLGVLRLNKLPGTRMRQERPAGVYALLEVIEPPALRPDTGDSGYADPNDGAVPRWRAKVRLLANLIENPIDARSLPAGEEFDWLRVPLQTSSIPLKASAFDEIVKRSGLDISEVRLRRDASTKQGVRKLERKAANLDPKRKEKISEEIERGSIGKQVKKARGYRCQICEALGKEPISFMKSTGKPYAEAHHVHPVSLMLAGSLSEENIMVLCANHHRQAHYGRFAIKEHREHDWQIEVDGTALTISRTCLG